MKRWCCACLLFCVIAPPARAHFVWIVPDQAGALLIFSDTLQPDAKVPVTKIAGTELFTFGEGGKIMALKATQEKDAYRVAAPAKRRWAVIGGVCRYGVVQKGKADPFLLVYCAKALVGERLTIPMWVGWQPTDRLPLDIVPIPAKEIGDEPLAQLRWQGKPLAGAEVVVLPPGYDKPLESKTDEKGFFALARPKEAGLYAIRARHVEAKEGDQDGKKYKEVRYYSTLTFPVRAAGSEARGASAGPPKADPEATRLLREARAARANWEKFPGFSADLEYNENGKLMLRGHVEVSAAGKVKAKMLAVGKVNGDLPGHVGEWATRELQTIVSHRLDNSAELNTPCAFIDKNTHHPLGRAIRVLNDELHSSYRIRDRQIIEVNRKMKAGTRFTIIVLHNHLTPEKKYLPVSYVMNTWAGVSKRGEELTSSTAFHLTWQRVGAFDLPETVLAVTAFGGDLPFGSPTGKLESFSMRLSNFKLAR
jgi:uncharacterized GH25 family protein